MTIVEAHELEGMITLDTPWSKLVNHPALANVPTDELPAMKESYEQLQASVEDNDEMLPWFPFLLTPSQVR